MQVLDGCAACLFRKQTKLAQKLENPTDRENYLAQVKEILENRSPEDTSPYLVYLFREVQKKYGLATGVYPKEEYNNLMLSMEDTIEKKIESSENPLELAMIYARIGNYIDFGAMLTVDPEKLMALLEDENKTPLDPVVYQEFCKDLEKAERFLLLTDNCGEVVLDKLLLRQLKKRYSHLKIQVMVRGEDVLNDATIEDAQQVGLDKEAEIISNGNAVAGTWYPMLSAQAKACFDSADVILAKGQGNYESLSGAKGNIYYSFLCKCDLFMTRFNVPQYTGMLVHERI